MISTHESSFCALPTFLSRIFSNRKQNVNSRFVRSSVLTLLLCGMGTISLAQTARFSGAQTVVGTGYNYPAGIAVDQSGDIYVADTFNNAIKEILAVNGSIPTSPTVLTLGSGFQYPQGVAVDDSGNVYVADTDNDAVNAPPPNRRWLRLRLEAGLIGHAADYTTLKSSSGVGGFCSSIYRFQTSSVTFPLVAAQ